MLLAQGAEVVRQDYSVEAWPGAPEGAIGWWKSQVPNPTAHRMHWAPNDVMLHFFAQLADQPGHEDLRYVLAPLLVRRRVLRVEEEEHDDRVGEHLVLYCPREEATYRVAVAVPDESRVQAIQDELAKLLFARAG